jgi:hypothetical protein
LVLISDPIGTDFSGLSNTCQRTARTTYVRRVAIIERVNHHGWMFQRLEMNKDQSKFQPKVRYSTTVLATIKINKNNNFRFMTARLSQKRKKNLKLSSPDHKNGISDAELKTENG